MPSKLDFLLPIELHSSLVQEPQPMYRRLLMHLYSLFIVILIRFHYVTYQICHKFVDELETLLSELQ